MPWNLVNDIRVLVTFITMEVFSLPKETSSRRGALVPLEKQTLLGCTSSFTREAGPFHLGWSFLQGWKVAWKLIRYIFMNWLQRLRKMHDYLIYTLKLAACIWLTKWCQWYQVFERHTFPWRPSLGSLSHQDWSTQPSPWRSYLGAPIIQLPTTLPKILEVVEVRFFICLMWFLCDLGPNILCNLKIEFQVIQLLVYIHFPFLNVS